MKKILCFMPALLMTFAMLPVESTGESENRSLHSIPEERSHSITGERKDPAHSSDEEHVIVRSRMLSIDSYEGVQKNIEELKEAEHALKEASDEESLQSRGYYASRNDAYHSVYGLSTYGDVVTLEDGSAWSVSGKDQWKTANTGAYNMWLSGDTVFVMQNKWKYTGYQFMLYNVNTGQEVEVNLSLGPVYNGLFTHWIVAIDYFNRLITLENGTCWSMSFFDSPVVNQWFINDTVIIGINQDSLSWNSSILINVNTLTFAKGIGLN